MSLPFLIAWRYLRRPTDRLVSAVGLVSILGLVIGVMALVISMALMTGYRNDLREKLLAGNAEIFIYSLTTPIDESGGIRERIAAIPEVEDASPVLFQQALITSEEHVTGDQVMLKGIDPSRAETSPMIARITGPDGFRWADGTSGAAIGTWLARKLKVEPGSAVSVTVPSEQSDSILPQSATFVVTHVFETGFFEFDSRWVFLPLSEAQELLRSEGMVNLLEVKLHDADTIDAAVAKIEAIAGDAFVVTDWREMNRQLFTLLSIQQLVLFIVIGLIVFVSTFNIVSTLIMTVHEKRKEIGILVAMGGDRRFIRRIFVWYGTLVGVAGTATGILIGIVTNRVITKYELISFGPEIAEVYFVSSIPFITRWTDIAAIAIFAVAVSFLSTLAPSARAARLAPAEAVRHE